MVKLKKKMIKGHPYYYIIKERRIKGKLITEWQVYLGSPKKILEKIQKVGPNQEIRIKSFEFGKLAAILAINEELKFTTIVNELTDKKKVEGLTVGEYLLITIFGRWCGPLSKKATAEHFQQSFLKFHFNIPHKMNAQNIFNHMKYIEDEETIQQISQELAQRLIEKGFTPSVLYLDTTNFFTYIENGGELLKPGESKQKQFTKNLVGVGLVATQDNLPILHETYPGNRHDSKILPVIVDRIVERLKSLKIDPETIAIVMDKGNNSQDNIDKILGEMHLVGSLKRDQVRHLLSIPLDEYDELYSNRKKHQISGYRTKLTVFGQEFTVVIRYNPATAKRQKKSYEKANRKFLTGMKELKGKYECTSGRGRRMGQAGVIRESKKLIYRNHESVFKFEFDTEPKMLRYWVDEEKEQEWYSWFGKTAVFTDMDAWTSTQIVKTYNGLHRLENDFHWLKDKLLIPITPMYVRKDESIRVHVFLCVIGLLFMRYFLWRLKDLDRRPKKLLGALEGIRVAFLSYENKKSLTLKVEELDPVQSRIFSEFDMWRYLKMN